MSRVAQARSHAARELSPSVDELFDELCRQSEAGAPTAGEADDQATP